MKFYEDKNNIISTLMVKINDSMAHFVDYTFEMNGRVSRNLMTFDRYDVRLLVGCKPSFCMSPFVDAIMTTLDGSAKLFLGRWNYRWDMYSYPENDSLNVRDVCKPESFSDAAMFVPYFVPPTHYYFNANGKYRKCYESEKQVYRPLRTISSQFQLDSGVRIDAAIYLNDTKSDTIYKYVLIHQGQHQKQGEIKVGAFIDGLESYVSAAGNVVIDGIRKVIVVRRNEVFIADAESYNSNNDNLRLENRVPLTELMGCSRVVSETPQTSPKSTSDSGIIIRTKSTVSVSTSDTTINKHHDDIYLVVTIAIFVVLVVFLILVITIVVFCKRRRSTKIMESTTVSSLAPRRKKRKKQSRSR
ncbi:hypothetical protein B4U80_13747 [Leptotrombidium deliense]|uniref:Uncharacterized protein n=1 Tax=Leptotrombidium deliense TaxID=299467 RepID=A0A443SGX0_9ACAR|nr:hypothetical protein B4U80_13747 [Leptotrombidium deliense]